MIIDHLRLHIDAFLPGKYTEALKVYRLQLGAFKELDSSIPENIRAQWETLPLEAKEGPRGKWTSVFSTPSSKGVMLDYIFVA